MENAKRNEPRMTMAQRSEVVHTTPCERKLLSECGMHRQTHTTHDTFWHRIHNSHIFLFPRFFFCCSSEFVSSSFGGGFFCVKKLRYIFHRKCVHVSRRGAVGCAEHDRGWVHFIQMSRHKHTVGTLNCRRNRRHTMPVSIHLNFNTNK